MPDTAASLRGWCREVVSFFRAAWCEWIVVFVAIVVAFALEASR